MHVHLKKPSLTNLRDVLSHALWVAAVHGRTEAVTRLLSHVSVDPAWRHQVALGDAAANGSAEPPLPPSSPLPTGARRAGAKRARVETDNAAETGGGPSSSVSPPPPLDVPSAQSAERPRPLVADSFAVKGWTELAWAITRLSEVIPTLKLGVAPAPGAVGAQLRAKPVGRTFDGYIPVAVESAARIALQPDMVQAARDDIARRQAMLTALVTVWENICTSASKQEALAILAEARAVGGALQRFV